MLNIPKTINGHLYLPEGYDVGAVIKALVSTHSLPWWIAKGALEEMRERRTFTEADLNNAIAAHKETQVLVDEMLANGEIIRELNDNFEWVYSNTDTSN